MRIALVIVMAAASVAHAKPLPAGMKVVVDGRSLAAVKGGVRVPLFDTDDPRVGRTWTSVKSATLSDDGKQIVLHAGSCMDIEDDAIEVPLATVEAQYENITGMGFHTKKQYADAIAHFTIAATNDPAMAVYATNLLSAQSMGNKLDDADQTIATYGPKNVAWFGWRLAVDSDLKNLRGRPSTKPYTAKPTSVVMKDEGGVAVSPLGLVAVGEWIAMGMGSANAVDVVIYDLKQNRRLMRLTLIAPSDACFAHPSPDMPPEMMGPPCTKAQLANSATNVRVVSAVLAPLGFVTAKAKWDNIPDDGKLVSPDKQITATFKGDDLTVTHGKATATLKSLDPTRRQIGWAGSAVVIQHKEPYQCGGADSVQAASDVLAVP